MLYTRIDEVLKRDSSNEWMLMNERLMFNEDKYWMSVQASKFHYCSPRIDTFLSDYESFEVMMEVPPELISEEWDQYESGGVYANVPKDLVLELVNNMKLNFQF